MLKEHLLKLTEYNLWANCRILDWLIQTGEGSADVNVSSSFTTLRKTVYHIYDAEYAWIVRLNDQDLAYWPPSRDFNFLMVEFSEILKAQSQALIDYIKNFPENQLDKGVSYSNVKSEMYSNTVADIVNHVVNHGTYHRGQLITMMRSLGFNGIGATDYIAYCRLTASKES